MNKKLLTAAIGAALAAGPMLASADVKLYGRVHVSVDYLDPKDAGTLGVLDTRKGSGVFSWVERGRELRFPQWQFRNLRDNLR